MVKRHNVGHEFLLQRGMDAATLEHIPFMRDAADLVGELLGGLYKVNLEDDELVSAWRTYVIRGVIRIPLPFDAMATYDNNLLLTMCYLSYAFGVRCELRPSDKQRGFDLVMMPFEMPHMLEVLKRLSLMYDESEG